MMYGQPGRQTSLQSVLGLVWGSPLSSTIGSGGWLLNTIVLRSSFLAGPSTGRAQAERLRLQMNLLMLPSLGLVIQIHGSEQHGKREKGWRDLSSAVAPYLFQTD